MTIEKTNKVYHFSVNQKQYTLELASDMPLLWVLRDYIKLNGTKYGCGVGECGACTVLILNKPVYSCSITVDQIEGKHITTIEGLADESLHSVQQAWLDEGVAQCGYCQSGQIMTAVSLLNQPSIPNQDEIDRTMSKVLCRCGTYPRINRAIHKLLNQNKSNNHE